MVDEIFLLARNYARCIDSTKGVIEGLSKTYNSYNKDQFKNRRACPPGWKHDLDKKFMKSYISWSSPDLTVIPDLLEAEKMAKNKLILDNLVLVGRDTDFPLEGLNKKMNPVLYKKSMNREVMNEKVIHTKTIYEIKKIFKKDKVISAAYNGKIDDLTFKDIMQIHFMCDMLRYTQYEYQCPVEFFEKKYFKYIGQYFHHFGNETDAYRAAANNDLKRIINMLEDFQQNPNLYSKKLLVFNYDDKIITRLYSFQGLSATSEKYLEQLENPEVDLGLEGPVYVATTIIFEFVEVNEEIYVNCLLNYKRHYQCVSQKPQNDFDKNSEEETYDCTQSQFISMLRSKLLHKKDLDNILEDNTD